jgi:hypothetical protein
MHPVAAGCSAVAAGCSAVAAEGARRLVQRGNTTRWQSSVALEADSPPHLLLAILPWMSDAAASAVRCKRRRGGVEAGWKGRGGLGAVECGCVG